MIRSIFQPAMEYAAEQAGTDALQIED